MQRSHILVLDSNDRLNPDITNANDCRLQIRPAIGGFDKIELLSFTLPIIQYNITASNNAVYFNIGGTDYIATLPDGCYTYLSLPPLLQTQLEAVSGGTFVVQYDELTFKIVVTITSAPSFSFTFSNTTNSAASILGFLNEDTTAASSQTSYYSLNLSLPLYFYIQIPEFGTHVRSTNEGDWATFVLSTDGNSGDILRFNMFSHYQLLESFQQKSLSTFTVRLVNRGGELLDLRGLSWTMVLKLYYKGTEFI